MNNDKIPTNEEINEALQHLLDEGCVDYGVNEKGELVFWATKKGEEINL
jgi:hypothetical protein